MTAHEPNPDQRRTEARNKPTKPPQGASPIGRLDVEALESQRAHERDLADRGARPVEDREPGTPVYPPFGQSGVPLVDDNGAPFPEETQQLFREVAQDAYLRGIRDQREREPAGPYAPTRDGRVVRGRVVQADQEWLGERFDRISTRLDGQEQRLTEHLRLISTKVDFLNQVDASEGDEPLLTQSAANAYGEREFERGRQQGDADRAQRELATDEEMNAPISDQAQKNVREALKSAEEHRHRGYEAGFSGGKIVGAAEREAELLDQGWTPPGAVVDLISNGLHGNEAATEAGWEAAKMMGAETPYSVIGGIINAAIPHLSGAYIAAAPADRFYREPDAGLATDAEMNAPISDQARQNVLNALASMHPPVEVTSGPTDYEVWRDALTLAVQEATHDNVVARAEFFRDKLINYPTISPDEADQAIDDQIRKLGPDHCHECGVDAGEAHDILCTNDGTN